MSLKNKKISIGITGGIAAYKIPVLIRLLKKAGAEVQPLMTDASVKFITELTIETVSQNPVARHLFPDDRFVGTRHIDMAEWPDLFVIAPATANFIGKTSAGICDDLLTTVICATKKPVMIFPAMNSNMYLNPITQNNINYLRSVGYDVVDPATGEMACDTYGPGRMPEPEEIFDYIKKFFDKKPSKKKVLENKKVIVTAGPCREPIDPVRFISNRSSGKMGFALASAAMGAGAKVTLITGPTNLMSPDNIKRIDIETTEQMFRAVKKEFTNADFLIMAAAPADYKIKKPANHKIKKGDKAALDLELIGTTDILAEIGKSKKKNQKLIGFALETDNGPANARAKLKKKNLDLIVLNTVGKQTPFDSDSNEIIVIGKNGRAKKINRESKDNISRILVEMIAKL